MYLVAGSITIIWALVVLLYLPPDPIRAKGFDSRERYIAVARLQVKNTGVRNRYFKKEQLYESVLDVNFWIVVLMSFLMMIVNVAGVDFHTNYRRIISL